MNVLGILLVAVVGIAIGWLCRWLYAKFKLTSVEQRAERLNQEAIKEAEAKSKELVLETRNQLLLEQQQQEREERERRSELQRTERRLQDKEESLEHKQTELDTIKTQQGDRETELGKREQAIVEKESGLTKELEKIASMTADEAKTVIMTGIPSSSGLADGPALVYLHTAVSAEEEHISPEKVGEEIQQFHNALESVSVGLSGISGGSVSQDILETHLLMLSDPEFIKAVERMIATELVCAPWI